MKTGKEKSKKEARELYGGEEERKPKEKGRREGERD